MGLLLQRKLLKAEGKEKKGRGHEERKSMKVQKEE